MLGLGGIALAKSKGRFFKEIAKFETVLLWLDRIEK